MPMRCLLAVATLLFVGTVVRTDEKEKDNEKVQGNWKATLLEKGGKKFPDDTTKKLTFVIKDNRLTFKNGDKIVEEVTFTLDPAKDPHTIDLTPVRGRFKDKVLPGIYVVEKDQLKLCYVAEPEKDRPKEFATRTGTALFLIILERDKP